MNNISTLKYLTYLLKRDTPRKTLCRDLQYQANGKPVLTGLCPNISHLHSIKVLDSEIIIYV